MANRLDAPALHAIISPLKPEIKCYLNLLLG
jgi:hypothetical protein